MDLSKVTSLQIVENSPFLNAKDDRIKDLKHVFDDGTVISPIVEGGKIIRFVAHDKTGKKVDLFYARLHPNDRCFACRESEERKQSFCVEFECDK